MSEYFIYPHKVPPFEIRDVHYSTSTENFAIRIPDIRAKKPADKSVCIDSQNIQYNFCTVCPSQRGSAGQLTCNYFVHFKETFPSSLVPLFESESKRKRV